jgi:UDP-glucose 4-epimerase
MTITGKSVLVTGGAGFIGSSIARALAAENRVKVFDDFSSGKKENLAGAMNIDVIKGDVRDEKAMAKAVSGMDIVFHEAANVQIPASIENPRMDADVNIRGTLNVLESCRKHDTGRVVFASSSALYGNPRALPVSESHPPSPMSPYAISKMCAETYMKLYSDLYGMQTVSLRYFNVYGPAQNADSPYSGVISIFMKSIAEGRPLKIYGDGSQTRDFVNIADVACANILAAESAKAPGKALNIGTGKSVSINDLVRILGKISGKVPQAVHEKPREGDVMHSRADIRLAESVLGYRPSVKLEDGLAEMLRTNGRRRSAKKA